MQFFHWRIHFIPFLFFQDAHNCVLNFDKETSLFAVYDGHGGADVAIYSSLHLPDAIKQTESYAKGDYSQALKDAFLEFDATLITDKVVKELEKIAQKHNGEAEGDFFSFSCIFGNL